MGLIVGIVAFLLVLWFALWLVGRGALRFRIRRGIGTYRWASRTDGGLTWFERAVLFVPLGSALVMYVLDRFVRWTPGTRKARAGWQFPNPPNGVFAAEADRQWAALIGVAEDQPHDDVQAALRCLHYHSLRTWVFGLALAERKGLALDPVAFYIAALGHDLGLVHHVQGAGHLTGVLPNKNACFTLNGADAIAIASRPADRLQAMQMSAAKEAIVQHITPGVTLRVDDRLGVFIQRGSVCDLTRQGARLIPEVDLHALFRRYPRSVTSSSQRVRELGELGAEIWPVETGRVRNGRARLLNTRNCFVRVIRKCPYEDVVEQS
jgi:hypothetical protein